MTINAARDRVPRLLLVCMLAFSTFPDVRKCRGEDSPIRDFVAAETMPFPAVGIVQSELLDAPPTHTSTEIAKRQKLLERIGRKPLAQRSPATGEPMNSLPAPDASAAPPQLQAPTDFLLKRDTALLGGGSTINEPSVASLGPNIFMTWNWNAALSTDEGQTFHYISPSLFPHYAIRPTCVGNVDFCCDQVAITAPTQGMVIWLLQYGLDDGGENIDRLAWAVDASDLQANRWNYIDLPPCGFNYPSGYWFDFPDMQVSNTRLWISSAVFTGGVDGQYVGSFICSINLEDLKNYSGSAAGSPSSIRYRKFNPGETPEPPRLTSGAKDYMYFGSKLENKFVRMWRGDDATGSFFDKEDYPIDYYVPLNRDGASVNPDGTNWAARADDRILGAYYDAKNSKVGMMWNCNSDGSGPGHHPNPYTRLSVFKLGDLTFKETHDTFDARPGVAWLYPSVAVNARGDIAGTIAFGGGAFYPGVDVWMHDQGDCCYPSPLQGQLHKIDGTRGSSLWGDYLTARPHDALRTTWIATGYVAKQGGVEPHFFWFGRARDFNQTQLLDGVAVAGTVAPSGFTYYRFDAPEEPNSLTIELSGCTGDPDLYVAKDGVPTESWFDYYATGPGCDTLTITPMNSPPLTSGPYYIGVYGDASVSGTYTIRASAMSMPQLTTGVPVSSTAPENGYTYFYVDVPTDSARMNIELTGCIGDPDLYVRKGAPPNDSSYDYFATLPGCDSLTISPTGPTPLAKGRWYIGVYGDMGSAASYTITATIIPMKQLISGVVASGTAPQNDITYFYVDVPPGSDSLHIDLTDLQGLPSDPDLLVRKGNPPTTSQYDKGSFFNGNDRVTISPNDSIPLPGRWYVGVFGDGSGEASYTVRATVSQPVQLSNGVPISALVPNSELKYFYIDVPQGGTSLHIDLTALVPDQAHDPDLYVMREQYPTSASNNSFYDIGSFVTGDDHLTIDPSTSPPLVPARWFIGVFGDGSSDSMFTIQATIQGSAINDSNIVSNTIPAQAPSNQSVPVDIVVKNTGSTQWRGSAGFALVATSDVGGLIPLGRIQLDPDESVNPGESYPFTTVLAGPPVAGDYPLELQMSESTNTFGQPLALMIHAVEALNDAVANGHTIPARLSAGESVLVGVSFKNAGSTTWFGGSSLLGLTVAQDNCQLIRATEIPILIPIRPDRSVRPNESYQFIVQITAPTTNGSCSLQFRMAESGVGFGGVQAAEVAIQDPPNLASNWELYE